MLSSLPLKSIKIIDGFWQERIRIAREVSIDYMWKALNDEIPDIPPSGCIRNFRIACGMEEGEFTGYQFQDSDLYKWLEAVAYSLESHPDKELENRADSVITLIEKAQNADGYINTFYKVKKGMENRWTDLCHAHEMYCVGHLIEAAVAYFTATGKDSLLNVAKKAADHIDNLFGPETGKKRGYPGHQEIELALVKLYRLTGEKRYLDLAHFLLDERGREPNYFEQERLARSEEERRHTNFYRNHGVLNYSYQQAHVPVYEQSEAVGHAVRAVYMLTGMADVGGEMSPIMLSAAKTLYRNIVDTQMYITGGIGSMGDGEAFTFPYDIPNDIMYTETCASIGLMMASLRLLNIEQRAEYADVMEKALYNNVLAGVSLAGTEYFYVNPLEVWPERSKRRHDYKWIKPKRQGWYGCACCPPNVLRTLLGLGQYIYSYDKDDSIYVNLFIASTVEFEIAGQNVKLTQNCDYPNSGKIEFLISVLKPIEFTLYIRIPGFCTNVTLLVCGEKSDLNNSIKNGYACIKRVFNAGDTIKLTLPMEAEFTYCDDRVPYNAGKAAIQRGPLIYCAEEVDNGAQLWNLSLDESAPIQENASIELPSSSIALTARGYRSASRGETLYPLVKPESIEQTITLVPYFIWGNRGVGEMAVWHRTN
ncbi:MAG: glycoside hydrolase family 127 protein [Treponema sp.]|nr:glycoside hydrolase family 127 protein [Treponema sp.]